VKVLVKMLVVAAALARVGFCVVLFVKTVNLSSLLTFCCDNATSAVCEIRVLWSINYFNTYYVLKSNFNDKTDPITIQTLWEHRFLP